MKRTMLRQILLKDQFVPDEREKPFIVGDDGELLQPDTTVYPDYYTYYKPAVVPRDAPLLNVYDNLRDNGLAYLLLSPGVFLGSVVAIVALVAVIAQIVDLANRYHFDFIAIIVLALLGFVGIVLSLGYLARRLRSPFR